MLDVCNLKSQLLIVVALLCPTAAPLPTNPIARAHAQCSDVAGRTTSPVDLQQCPYGLYYDAFNAQTALSNNVY